MDSQRQQAVERIKKANNILVTVSNNPTVDQLAALMGITLTLNKMGKHATAVFSGIVPSTLEFLQPQKTIEKNTDSLRDFIISLDKSKADKLRYKVEDKVVKIFITPYKTSISSKDLEFSQGDFNVDVVLALGVHNQAELDQAITSHGRILHDATVITVNIKPGGELGGINWLDPSSSSLSELAVELVDDLDRQLIDGQIATSFLTGIVAETDRFSNSKTSPRTMSISAELMGEGANQQLVALKLQEPVAPPAPAPIAKQAEDPKQPAVSPKSDDGTLEILHIGSIDDSKKDEEKEEDHKSDMPVPKPPAAMAAPDANEEALATQEAPPEEAEGTPEDLVLPPTPQPPTPQINIDEHGEFIPTYLEEEDVLPPVKQDKTPTISHHNEAPKMVLTPPTLGGVLNASGANSGAFDTEDEDRPSAAGFPAEEAPRLDESYKEKDDQPLVSSDTASAPADEDQNAPGTSFLGDQPLLPPPPLEPHIVTPAANETLSDIEREVNSSHMTEAAMPKLDASPLGDPSDHQPLHSSEPARQSQPATGAMLPPVMPEIPVITPTTDTALDASEPASAATAQKTEAAEGVESLNSARDAVMQAIGSGPAPTPEAVQALNAQNADLPLGAASSDTHEPANAASSSPLGIVQPWSPGSDTKANADAPPAVPPPMMPTMPVA